MSNNRYRRSAVWLIAGLTLWIFVQVIARPGFDHWESLANESREAGCPAGGTDDPRSKAHPDGMIKTIRLTERGTYVDRCELVDALQEIHWDHTRQTTSSGLLDATPGPNLVVVYIHGWLNDERQTDGNFVDFKNFIGRLRQEQETADVLIGHRVTGIYLTWPARSDIPIYQYLTFWSRMGAADRISQSGIVSSTIGAINHALDQTSSGSNQLILIGHSFGARILHAATSQSMLYALQLARPHEKGGQYKLVRGIADAVILLNPAFEATMFASIDNVRRDTDKANFDPGQQPLFVTIATSNDQATKYAFPVAQWLANRSSTAEMTTIGNFSDYFTHSLRWVKKREDCDTELNAVPLTKGFFVAARPDQGDGRGICLNRLQSGRGKVSAPNDPFLVVETNPDIIDNHSGIWAPDFSNWLFGFVNEFALRQRAFKKGNGP